MGRDSDRERDSERRRERDSDARDRRDRRSERDDDRSGRGRDRDDVRRRASDRDAGPDSRDRDDDRGSTRRDRSGQESQPSRADDSSRGPSGTKDARAPAPIDHNAIDPEQEAQMMAQMLGMHGFGSTKGKQVSNNEEGAFSQKSKLKMTQRGNQKQNKDRKFEKRR
eukprot:TRINITY_DN47970_c0_g1_i1.p1 TRINITY_DN47970_c0_g1~~TRINITY_DN47970_c0_g1_i1.p1  ORF type:complete len:167 (+),score=41.55 TRINITY_DN47970_c0_g1_i1:57-557(+)